MCRVSPYFPLDCVSSCRLPMQLTPETGRTACTKTLRKPHGFCTRVCILHPVSSLHSSSFRSPSRSPNTHARYVAKYGRNVRIRGLGPVGAFETYFGIQLIASYRSGMTASCPLILSLCLTCSRILPSTRNPCCRVDSSRVSLAVVCLRQRAMFISVNGGLLRPRFPFKT